MHLFKLEMTKTPLSPQKHVSESFANGKRNSTELVFVTERKRNSERYVFVQKADNNIKLNYFITKIRFRPRPNFVV